MRKISLDAAVFDVLGPELIWFVRGARRDDEQTAPRQPGYRGIEDAAIVLTLS